MINVKHMIISMLIVCTLSGCKDASQEKEFVDATAESIIEQSDESVADETYQNILETIKNMDFSVKTPCVEISTEEDILYRTAYLNILKNEIPIINEAGESVYYRDLWKAGIDCDLLEESGTKTEYPYGIYYSDLDGDGLPELGINQGCFYLLKYDSKTEECRLLYSEQSCYFKGIIGAGQIWYRDGLHANIVRDRFIALDESGEWNTVFDLQYGLIPETPYYSIGISQQAEEHIEVDEDEWNELTKPFYEITEQLLAPQSFEDVFGKVMQ